MNVKAEAIGITPGLIVTDRIRAQYKPVASVALRRGVLRENLAMSLRPRGSTVLRSTEDRAEEIWETITYAAIWLCGLTEIWLCLFN
jgi:hypothetical protein